MAYAPAINLGPLQHFPLNSAASKVVVNGTAISTSWSAAVSCASLIPVGAKAVWVKTLVELTSVAAGLSRTRIHFSDNNSISPNYAMAHPMLEANDRAAGAGEIVGHGGMMVIPLNASGQFYFISDFIINCTGSLIVVLCGYYMGG